MTDSDQLRVAFWVGEALEAAGARWVLGGSLASSAFGHARTTQDVDLATDLEAEAVDAFLTVLGDRFYADRDAALTAARRRASFNVIHFDTVEKVDVFCVRAGSFGARGLDTPVLLTLADGTTLPVARPEHMVVEKLRWFRRGGEISERQLRDVLGVLQVSGPRLDIARMRDDADTVGVADLLETALRDAGLA